MSTTTSHQHPSAKEIGWLRWFRTKLVAAIEKQTKLSIPADFTVSAAGAKGKGYTLEVSFKRSQPGYATFVRKIEDQLEIARLFSSADKTTLVANFLLPVREKMVASEDENQIQADPVKKQTITPVKKSADKYQTFLGDIRAALAPIIPLEELTKSYVLKKYDNRNETAEIAIPDSQVMNSALHALEAKGYKITMLGTSLICTPNNSELIETLPHHKRLLPELKKLTTWMEQVRHWIQEEDLNMHIVSHPLFIVQSNYEEEVAFQCESAGISSVADKAFYANDLSSRKNMRMVYVKLSPILSAKPFLKIKVERKGLNAKKGTEGEGAKYVHQTLNYDELHLLPFNRDIDLSHAEGIAKSIDEFGVIDFVKVVETDCVDGSLKKWIVDGQHTYTAEKKRGLPVLYVLIKVDTLSELVRLTAVLNNRRKPWKSKDYLNAWASLNVPVYKSIESWTAKKLGFSLILEALGDRDPKAAMLQFKDGNFAMGKSGKGEQLLQYIFELKHLLPRSMKVQTGVLRFIRGCENYDHRKMKTSLEKIKSKVFFAADDSVPLITKKIFDLYNNS